MPRTEISWLSGSNVTPGVYFARSAKDLTFKICILAFVKALTLSVTLLSDCSLRVAVTITSPTSVAPAWIGVAVVCAVARPAHTRGMMAVDARTTLTQPHRSAIRGVLHRLRIPDSYPTGSASRLCDHITPSVRGLVAGAHVAIRVC
jgi:hypothetical protein